MNPLKCPYPIRYGNKNPLKLILNIQRQDLPQRITQEEQLKSMPQSREQRPYHTLQAPTQGKGTSQDKGPSKEGIVTR